MIQTPADLFLEWYLDLVNRPAIHGRSSCDKDELLLRIMRLDDGGKCASELISIAQDDARLKMRVLETIDDWFGSIHPRGGVRGPARTIPNWLAAAEQTRCATAHYAQYRGYRLVARGPIVRSPKSEEENYAAILADRFTSLRVTNQVYEDKSKRRFVVVHQEIQSSELRSVTSRSDRGEERIVFAPLLFGAKEWDISTAAATPHDLVSIRPVCSANAVQRLMDVSEQMNAPDILIAPEFCMPDDAFRILVDALQSKPQFAPSLLVSGSGLTEERDDSGLPFNEARVINQYGARLLIQRKLFPSQVDATTLRAIDLQCVSDRAVEGTAACHKVAVTDIVGFGRILVLICHDIKADPVAASVIQEYEPDWVFVPLFEFDRGIDKNRWNYAQVFQLSIDSNVRFVACSSVVGQDCVNFGMVHGPRKSYGGVPERAVAFISRREGNVDCGELKWGPDERWLVSNIAPEAS